VRRRETYARATGRLVRKPNMKLARPETAAVAVTISRRMSIVIVWSASASPCCLVSVCLSVFTHPLCKQHMNQSCHMRVDPSSHIHKYRQTERAEQPIYRQPTELRQKRIENSYVDSDDVRHSRKGCDTSANFSKEGRSGDLLRLQGRQLRQLPPQTEGA